MWIKRRDWRNSIIVILDCIGEQYNSGSAFRLFRRPHEGVSQRRGHSTAGRVASACSRREEEEEGGVSATLGDFHDSHFCVYGRHLTLSRRIITKKSNIIYNSIEK